VAPISLALEAECQLEAFYHLISSFNVSKSLKRLSIFSWSHPTGKLTSINLCIREGAIPMAAGPRKFSGCWTSPPLPILWSSLG